MDREVDPVHVRFPPRWQNVLVPTTTRVATAAGMTLYTASRPRTVVVQRCLWALARSTGSRLVPGPREQWSLPYEQDVADELWRAWSDVTGSVDGVAVYHRPQAARTGLVLLLCGRRRWMVVRLRHERESLVLEERLARAASDPRPRSFRVPRLMQSGSRGDLHWLGYEVMARRPHAPARRFSNEAFEEVSQLVERTVPRPPGTPHTWRGAHGDLTPWNLRRAGGATWLIDWEDACWAPAGLDAVYWGATRAAMRRADPTEALDVHPDHEEARAHLSARLTPVTVSETEQRLQRRLRILLSERRAS